MTKLEMFDDLISRYYQKTVSVLESGSKQKDEEIDLLRRSVNAMSHALTCFNHALEGWPQFKLEDNLVKDEERKRVTDDLIQRLYNETILYVQADNTTNAQARDALCNAMDAISTVVHIV